MKTLLRLVVRPAFRVGIKGVVTTRSKLRLLIERHREWALPAIATFRSDDIVLQSLIMESKYSFRSRENLAAARTQQDHVASTAGNNSCPVSANRASKVKSPQHKEQPECTTKKSVYEE